MTTRQPDIYGDGEPLTGDLARGAYISIARVILVSVVSMGIYWVYWMYRTWKQYRDHTIEMSAETGDVHHPVWHGLTQVVPVYGWFRYHAHIRLYKELMAERGVPDTLNLGLLTTVVVINGIVALIAGGMRNPALPNEAVVAAGKLYHKVSAGKPARDPDGAHRRLGPGVHQPHHLDRWRKLANQLGHLDFALGRGPETRPRFDDVVQGLGHFRVPVPQNQRPPGADVVDVGMAVRVVEMRARAALDKHRIAAHGPERPRRRVDAAGNLLSRLLEKFA